MAKAKRDITRKRSAICGHTLDKKLDFLRSRIEVKGLAADGTFTGYAAVFDVRDTNGDIIEPGAFAETLAEWADLGTMPRVKWRHDESIGHVLEMAEDDHGLLVKGQIWDLSIAEELAKSLADGESIGMSFAYWPAEGGEELVYETDEAGMPMVTRRLSRLILGDDITITARPVQMQAELLEVKDRGATPLIKPAVLEGCLRDAGCSRTVSKRILAGGLPALREAGPGEAALASLREIADLLK